jgi:imidazolonepropionase
MIKAYTHLNEILTLKEAHKKDGRNLLPSDLSIIEDGSIVFDEHKILWIGKTSEFPQQYKSVYAKNLQGHVLTPELVDSHTHTVFGGDRAQEYADRLNGISYEEIAKRGGGILFTMKETNSLSDDELFLLAMDRIERIHSYGVGTLEIKSGYALNFEKEYAVSKVIDRLKTYFHPRVQISNTYLAAHDVPKSFNSSKDYLEEVVLPLLEKLAEEKIIDAVDIFHEKNYFSAEDTINLFEKAAALKLPVKIHADELNTNGSKV